MQEGWACYRHCSADRQGVVAALAGKAGGTGCVKRLSELDRLAIQTEVTKKFAEEIDSGSRDGAYLTGFFITGATFDPATSTIEKSKPRQMETVMPVVNVKSVLIEKLDLKGVFEAPCYKTQQRGPTYVFSAQLKTKSPAARWSMAGACILLDAS